METRQDNLPANGDGGQERRIVGQVQHFSGPLPPPALLRQYEEVAVGSAERIIRKFENQTDHRIRIENRVVWTDSIKEIGGLVAGFIIAMTAIIGGIFCALKDHPFLGGGLSFSGLALLVGAFLANTYLKPAENNTPEE